MKKNIMLLGMILLSVAAFSQEDLDEVKITKKQKGIKKSYTLTSNTSVITSKE